MVVFVTKILFQAYNITLGSIVTGIWWFFTLIMVSSYTANLASFLLVQEKDEPIKNLQDLQRQDVIKYGCVGSGSTAGFFKVSYDRIPTQHFDKWMPHVLSKMKQNMMRHS